GFEYRRAGGLPRGAGVVAAAFGVTESTREAVAAAVDRHLAHRAGTQPIDVPSCGSVFKNPPRHHAGRGGEAPRVQGRGRGARRAEISSLHANSIVTRGGATARDVLALIEEARARVRERSGIELEPEVRIVGREAA